MTEVRQHEPHPLPDAALATARDFRKRNGVRLLWRLLAYHATLALLVFSAAAWWPGFVDYLPIGGVEDLVARAALDGELAQLTATPASTSADVAGATSTNLDRLGYARQLSIILLGTWLLVLPVSWVHRGVHKASSFDHSLDETVLLLPGTVAALVMVVQHSLALAFSLAGIVAGVQFRRALQDTFDALYILVAIGTGIAAGVRALEVAAVLTVFFCYATLYVYYSGDGFESDFVAGEKEKKRQRKQGGKEKPADQGGDQDD